MPKTAELTHNEWLLGGGYPDSDVDTGYDQINVTFPNWQKHIKKDADFLTKAYKFPNRSAFIKELIDDSCIDFLFLRSSISRSSLSVSLLFPLTLSAMDLNITSSHSLHLLPLCFLH